MTVSIELRIKQFNLPIRAHARLMKDINRRVMERQRDERVPQHFENIAYSKYKAKKRSSKYNEEKQKQYGHKKPNVRSGYLKDSLRFKVTATQYGSRLLIRASLNNKLPQAEWEAMTPEQQERWKRKNVRRLANWQKREIAVLSKTEIREERQRQAVEYRRGALSPQYKRKRAKRIK